MTPRIEVDAGPPGRARLGRARAHRRFRLALAAVDALALAAAFATAYLIRFELEIPVFRTEVVGSVEFYSRIVFMLIPLWLGVFALIGLYDEHNLLGGTREYSLAFNAVSTGMLLVVLATFLNPEFVIARGWLLVSWALAFLCVAAGRFAVRRWIYRLRRRGLFVAPALLLGTNEEALSLARQLSDWKTSGLDVRGFVTPGVDDGGRIYRNLYTLGTLDDLVELVETHGIEELIVATSALSRPQLVDVFRRVSARDDVRLRLSSGLFEVMTTGVRLKELAFAPLIEVQPVRLIGVDRVAKAMLDYSIALAVAGACLPLFAAIGLAIRVDSPGPILHRRRVLGLGGRAFDAFKFRSMHADADSRLEDEPELADRLATYGKLKDDPRVTRIGKVLRASSLDELPQVFNVLRGEMSIVGPRMISPAEHERYGQWDLNLLTVKPGITGLWQVSGRSDLSYEDRVRLDMNYIRNWTIWLDLQILLQTVPAVLFRRGAY